MGQGAGRAQRPHHQREVKVTVPSLPGADMERTQVEGIAGGDAMQPVVGKALALQRAAGCLRSVDGAVPLAVEGGDELDVVEMAVGHQHTVGPLEQGAIRDLPVDGLVQRKARKGIHGDCDIIGLEQQGSRAQPGQFHFCFSSSSNTR